MENRLDATLAALSDPSRRAVVELLKKSPLCPSEIASRLAMSRHLRVLRRSGLVEEDEHESDARIRLYRLRPERFAELRGWVEEVEAFWGEQLAGFKAYAERRQRRRPT